MDIKAKMKGDTYLPMIQKRGVLINVLKDYKEE